MSNVTQRGRDVPLTSSGGGQKVCALCFPLMLADWKGTPPKGTSLISISQVWYHWHNFFRPLRACSGLLDPDNSFVCEAFST